MSGSNCDCLFCKIAAGEIPSYKVAESDKCYAFLDIQPVAPGHTLVIPRYCARRVQDLPTEYAHALMEMVQKVAAAVTGFSGSPDCNIIVNNGPTAGQVIPHTHFHVIPRKEGDSLPLPSAKGKFQATEDIATEIRKHM